MMEAEKYLKTRETMIKYIHSCERCRLLEMEKSEPEKAVKSVEEWAKEHPQIELTEKQVAAIKGRNAEGFLWVSKFEDEDEYVVFTQSKPKKGKDSFWVDEGIFSSGFSNVFDFVTFANSPLYLPDLLEGVEQ